ncbi:hypothetical protein [Halovivax cerinus]|uniref:Uncharacterized protein n=1 Tax=Halovivax cerinus TaxID=1487865 RepID=A0ABD5NRY2_9EURY|nr:hypothetical protein [Halovivax cerinus]
MVDRNDQSGAESTDAVETDGVSRRSLLRGSGSAALLAVGAAIPGTATPDTHTVVRLEGSYGSPITFEEAQDELGRTVRSHARADDSVLDTRSRPVFGDDVRIVEYVARIDGRGHLSEFYGGATKDREAKAHTRGEMKRAAFEDEGTIADVSPLASETDYGGDWNFVKDNQASADSTFGTVINNYEWYRIREDGDEHNSFRSRSATAPEQSMATSKFEVAHDWDVSELGDEDVHTAEPTSSGSGSFDVSLGDVLDPLSWSFTVDNGITQSLDNDGPTITWTQGGIIGGLGGGTHWLHPGSHVVSDRADCSSKQTIVQLSAEAEWIGGGGMPYDEESHTWEISTVTC